AGQPRGKVPPNGAAAHNANSLRAGVGDACPCCVGVWGVHSCFLYWNLNFFARPVIAQLKSPDFSLGEKSGDLDCFAGGWVKEFFHEPGKPQQSEYEHEYTFSFRATRRTHQAIDH